MKAAICDDQPQALEELRKILLEIPAVRKVHTYSDMDNFWATLEAGIYYDVVFMDIDWNQKETGIDFAGRLFEISPYTKLIYVTAYTMDYVEDIFFTHTNLSGFLKKPVDKKVWYHTANEVFDLAHQVTDAIAKKHPLYEPATRMQDLVKDSDPIIHHTFDAGEGVLIPGEIMHHAKHGCKFFVILQPFGCLPNHVVGRGISKRLKEYFPDIHILTLDYDPDVSFANVENRLQMLVMNAKKEKG